MVQRELPWWIPVFKGDETASIESVVQSGFVNDGPQTALLEQKIAAFCSSRYCVAVTSGTAALFLALKALNVGPGDEVLVPDLTFIATANAVTMAGAKPVLVDIEANTLGMDPQVAASAITPQTKAIMAVHVSGRPARIDELCALADKHGLVVVEDAAEALGSRHNDKQLGTFGAAGCFSLSPNKTITTGQGGLIVTDDESLYIRLRALKDQGRPLRGTGGPDVHDSIGFNFKFTDLQAAMGRVQLQSLPERLNRLKRHYEGYAKIINGLEKISLLPFDISAGNCPQWIDAIANTPAARDSLCSMLKSENIGFREFWRPLHTQVPYRQSDDAFPVSASVCRRALWLPSALTLGDEDVNLVAELVRGWSRDECN